jgi:hypothetical protein
MFKFSLLLEKEAKGGVRPDGHIVSFGEVYY